MDARPLGRCVHERHRAPDGLCRQVVQVDLTDGRQAKAFIKGNQRDLEPLEPRINASSKLRLDGGDVTCPRL